MICDECVFRGETAAELYPPGTIVCKKCKNWRHFVVYAQGGGHIVFEFACKDYEGEMVYRPVSSGAQLSEAHKSRIKALQCLQCKQPLQLFFLAYNKYVKDYYNVGPEEPEAGDSEPTA